MEGYQNVIIDNAFPVIVIAMLAVFMPGFGLAFAGAILILWLLSHEAFAVLIDR